MKVVILFASLEGQTRKISHFAQDMLRNAGHDVALFDAAGKTAGIDLENADRIILAGSVHERRHPMALEVFIAAHRHALEARPTLLISVSLSAAFPEGLEEAEDYLVEMMMRTRFTPSHRALVAGAVRTREYDYFARQVVRHVVLRGRDYDPNEEEHEFTDWVRLGAALRDFMSPRRAALNSAQAAASSSASSLRADRRFEASSGRSGSVA
ncbi:flavodoxin domain-containing protein [Limimaricola sp. AA108-03]|uniref:flavodoxin domain-containing protein n=1 Tax=Limimaricola sp. AA108-03 TaxID=3425945 RepID=UPI003D76CEA8